MKELFEFVEGLPLQVSIKTIDEYPIHMHDTMELIYVLEGQVDLKISFHQYELKQGEFVIVNSFEVHSIKKKSDSNVIMFFQLDKKYFEEYFPDFEGTLFIYDPYYYQNYNHDEIREIKKYLLEAALEMSKEKEGYEKRVNQLIIKCLGIFLKDFQMQFFSAKYIEESIYKNNKTQLDRLLRINQFLYLNYNDKISLEMLAEKEHINKYYLTHLIKYSTGYSFQELINIVRIDRAETLLLGTSKTIEEIVSISGFSSNRFLNKYFKQFFNLSPSEYRKKNKNEVLGKKKASYIEFNQKERIRIIENLLYNQFGYLSKEIKVDLFDKGNAYLVKKPDTIWTINIYEEYIQQHRELLKKEQRYLNLRYCRIVCREKQEGTQDDIERIGEFIQTLFSLNIIPIINVSCRNILRSLKKILTASRNQFGYEKVRNIKIETADMGIYKICHKLYEDIIDPSNISVNYFKENSNSYNYYNDTEFTICSLVSGYFNGNGGSDQELFLMDSNESDTFFHGEPGLITRNGISKASLYGYYFLSNGRSNNRTRK